MAFVRIAALSDLPAGALRHVEIGDVAIAVGNREGEIFAIGGHCPHARGPLGHGALNGRMVTCPWHLWEFDCATGVCDFNPKVSVPVYQTKVEAGEVYVELA